MEVQVELLVRLMGLPSTTQIGEPSHAREWRWPADFQININSRHPVMRVVIGLTRQMFDVFGCTCDYCDGRLQFCC
ncbi:hypothetical protein Poly51_59180 [Rubripirellula tenax]|uniref:Uncharacterized protein n=1 Tax=Rubripirellula tenax TaxID=2528015 RepID=A0A5C6EBX8_9BACT|nr:hypothetical protein Poly51_59180 [Rubripirellula tenax]